MVFGDLIRPGLMGGVLGLALLACGNARADNTWEHSVQVSAAVQVNPPQITLSWPQDVNGTPLSYTIRRKAKEGATWGQGTVLPGTATNYIDANIGAGKAYEYQIHKAATGYEGYGYVFAGIETPAIEDRGKLILIVDTTYAEALRPELDRLKQDLVGDGWRVLRHDVARSSSPPEVKAIIRAEYERDPANVRCVFLFGRVPVPYSGNLSPDEHTEELGAWPADVYYAEMTSEWTDLSVSNATALTARRWNVPGDGKFDQSAIPSSVELQLGRVDLAHMPGRKEWMGPPTFPSELELLRNYLNKNHNFRHKQFSAEPRGLVYDGAGAREGAAFAANGWRNFAPFFGAASIRIAAANEFLPILTNGSYLWSYANGGADSQSIAYLGGSGHFSGGRTVDLVEMDVRTVFTMLFGSHLGDWDAEDNIMRSILATPTYGLTCAFGGAPHWFFHHMGLGETIGYSTRLTQNNIASGIYRTEENPAAGMVHVALMGDPTLRLHPVAPPTNLTVSMTAGIPRLKWGASPDPVLGYHVYRSTSVNGPFSRITQAPVTELAYSDTTGTGGPYMVRAVKLEISASGSYFNLSQGVFATTSGSHDSDGDGVPDTDEISAGTDPNDPDSVLRILSVAVRSDGALTISWSSVSGKTYRVVRREILSSAGWNDVSEDIPSDGLVTLWSGLAPSEAGLYRVVLIQ